MELSRLNKEAQTVDVIKRKKIWKYVVPALTIDEVGVAHAPRQSVN